MKRALLTPGNPENCSLLSVCISVLCKRYSQRLAGQIWNRTNTLHFKWWPGILECKSSLREPISSCNKTLQPILLESGLPSETQLITWECERSWLTCPASTANRTVNSPVTRPSPVLRYNKGLEGNIGSEASQRPHCLKKEAACGTKYSPSNVWIRGVGEWTWNSVGFFISVIFFSILVCSYHFNLWSPKCNNVKLNLARTEKLAQRRPWFVCVCWMICMVNKD